jgi:predicted metal-dependent phosphoesterase TrpH
MSGFIDLHMHTNHSDGSCSPEEVLQMVRDKGLVAFSVTDHDTLDGFRAIRALRKPDDPELITGVELSVLLAGDDVHMLAYLFEVDDVPLDKALTEFQKMRKERGKKIVDRLQELGLQIPFEAVMATAGTSVVGRPHIAHTLHRLGMVGGYQEAFDRYIHRDGPAYVAKVMMTAEEAISLVHKAGGITSLAHPFLDNMAKHIEALAALGLDAIEVRHSTHSNDDVRRLERIAAKHGLVVTGGSDFHAREGRYGSIGSQRVPSSYLDMMKERAWQIRNQN